MKDKVILKIGIRTVGHQDLRPDTKGTLIGFDRDHFFVDFNGEMVAFLKDEADEEISIE